MNAIAAVPAQVNKNGRPRYWMAFLIIAVLFMAAGAVQRYAMYQSAQAAAETNAKNLSLVLESGLSADFAAAERMVSEMVTEIDPEAMRPENAARYRAQITRRLKVNIENIASASSLRYFDANGERLYSSGEGESPSNIADRPHYQAVKAEPGNAVIYSEVALGRSDQRISVYGVRAVRDKHGSFLGVATVAIDLTSVQEQFSRIDLGNAGAVALRRLDNGALVVRYPGRVEVDNRPAPQYAIRLAILNDRPVGVIAFTSQTDQIRRLYGYRKVGAFPFYVAVGIAENDYLAEWRRNSFLLLAYSLLFLSILGFVFARLAGAEQGARNDSEKNRTLLRNASDGIHILDRDGNVIEVSESFCAMLGYSRDEMLGMNVSRWDATFTDSRLRERVRQNFAQKVRFEFETSHRRKDGTIFDAEVSTYPVELDGKPVLFCSTRDITERKRVEQVLRLHEERLRLAMEATRQGWFEVNVQTGDVIVSPEYARILGYEPAEFKSTLKGWIDGIHPEDSGSVLKAFAECLESGESRQMEYRRQTKAGDWKWIRSIGQVVERDASGKPLRVTGTHADISEHRRAEDALRIRDNALQHSLDAVAMADMGGRLTYVNDAFLQLWRLGAAAQALGRPFEDFSKDADAARQIVESMVPAGIWRGELIALRHDGSQFDAEIAASVATAADGTPIAMMASFVDISERKRAQRNLNMAVQVARLVMWEADFVNDRLNFDKEMLPNLGLDIEMHVNSLQSWIDSVYAEDRGLIEDHIRSSMRPDGPEFDVEYRMPNKAGQIEWINTKGCVVQRSADGQAVLAVGTSMNITARKCAQTALAESHRLLQAVIDTAPMRVFWKGRDLRYLGCNPAFARDAGMAHPRDVIGKDDYQMGWVDQAGLYQDDDRQVIESAVGKLFYDEPQTTPDGGTIWLRTSKVPLRNYEDRTIGVLGIYEDITDRKRAEEALRDSENRSRNLASLLRLMCDNVPDMIWAKDLEKRYVFANQSMCRNLLNATDTDEPLGKTDLFFAQRERGRHPDNPQWHTFGELCQDSDDATLQKDRTSVFEEFGNVKGQYVVLDVHKSPFRNEKGEVIGTVGSARDVTDQKIIDNELQKYRERLEELVQQRTTELMATEARASHILESSADGLYGVDHDGIITFINPAACSMLGYSAGQVIGRSAHALFHHSKPDGTPYPVEECPGHQALASGQLSRVDNEVYWHADGHAVPVMYALHPMMQNGVNRGSVISVVDVTELRAAAEAREQALIAAENLARVRHEFLANMSHEIRTPLNGVLGFAQLGRLNVNNRDKTRNAFEKILLSGNLLLGVVNDILDFSKIEAGKIGIENAEVCVVELIDEVLEIVRERARIKQLDLVVEVAPDLPQTCMSDALRLRQVLLNLLSNAVKFTESGSIRVSACREGDQLVFRIADTGIGMNEEQLDRLFNPFQQADSSTTRRFGGTGLGLAISKGIVELMGGAIHVGSKAGVGSTFEFRLPYVSTADPAVGKVVGEAAATAAKPLAGISILVAEDDAFNQMLLEEVLMTSDGARLVIVGNGREALERVVRDGPGAYDLVLMDIQMPEMDGYETAKRILEVAPGLPIIGQTAHALREDREKCLAAGMVDHIAKPIDLEALVRLVRKYALRKRRN